MRCIVFTFCWLGLFFTAWSQSGNYFLAHYSPNKDKFHNVCFDIAQDNQGLIYFATRSGILQFDGRDWDLIGGSGAIYSLQLAKSGVIYWAGASGYGLLSKSSNGHQQLVTLSEGVKDVIQTLAINENVYFVNEEKIFITTLGKDDVSTIKATNLTGSFNSIFELFGVAYVNTESGGVYKIVNEKLVRSTLPLSLNDQVIFSTGLRNMYLLGASNSKLYMCGEDLKLREVKLEDSEYANASVIVNGKWVNRELFVVGTLRGGMMFIHWPSGKTQEIINYSTGLPDNEVFALLNDKSQCIWAAHEYGFTRISPYLPFRSFSHYPGLQGNLLCARSYQNNVYVGTSLGLFKLEKEDVYEEITYYVDVETKVKVKNTGKPKVAEQEVVMPSQEEQRVTEENQSKKRGFFSFLKRKKLPKESTPELTETKETAIKKAETPAETQSPKEEFKSVFKREKRTEKVLRTSQFVYKKVEGVDAKVTQLTEMNGALIAAGLGGTYEIDGLNGKQLLEAPTRYVYASEKGILLATTYSDQLKCLRQEFNEWVPVNILQNLDDQINYIFDGHDDEIWLCALDKIYRLTISQSEVRDIQITEINNRNFDEFVGIRWHDEIMLVNADGFFLFNKDDRKFSLVDSLAPARILNYFAQNNRVWYRDLHTWNIFGSTSGGSNLRLLNLFESLRFISPDQDPDNLWIITGTNELYKFYGERLTPYQSSFPILLKAVKNGDVKIGDFSRLKINQENSSVTFEIVQPDYLASKAIEYRYQLKGLDEDWTDWSNTNNNIDFPYLPSGDYVLVIQSRDIFGHIQNMPGISFEIVPPYWKRPWFYALEFFVFAFLVVLSFRLSTRYRIVSRILMLLTIIMLIEFIQTAAGETFETKASPVMDFFVQVLIAILALPVEGYLRGMVMRSLDSSHRLYRFLSPKTEAEINSDKEEQ